MAIQLVVPGRAVELPPQQPHAEIPGATVLVAVESALGIRGAEQEQIVRLPPEVRKEDVVLEVDLGDGVRQWSALTQLEEDGVAVPQSPRGGESVIRIAPVVRRRDGTRSAGAAIVKGLKVLHIDPARTLAQELILPKFEGQIVPGLKGLDRDGRFIEPKTLEGSGPYLLFVHGTASSTHGGFGELFVDKAPPTEPDRQNLEYQNLFDEHEGRVLALEHKTLSVSPITNALDLVSALPDQARLRIVSHSRGGLIAELLCLDPNFSDTLLDPFDARHADQKADLQRLRGLLQQKQFVIEKFVRVACPARGTILASKRIDLYASVLLNVLLAAPKAFTGPVGDAAFDALKEVLVDLVKLRTDPSELPGLEAQMPTSPLVRFLRANPRTAADLAVISGDVEGSGFWGRLKVLATDAFYLTDHDLVVDTKSMYGGVERDKKAHYFFDKGADVNHFSYFRNKRTRAKLASWLTDGSGFEEFDTGVEAKLPPSPRDLAARPIVFVVPAEFGSALVAGDGTAVWPDAGELLRRGVESLFDPALKPGRPTRSYQPLLDYLSSRYDVRPVGWDWRSSIADAADVLRGGVAEAAGNGVPVHFIGHGAGGLVIRMLAAKDPVLWQQVMSKGGRALMLGTPQTGTHWSLALLAGADRLVRLLSMIGRPSDPQQIAAQFARCEAVLDLLPDDYLPLDDNNAAARWSALGIAPNVSLGGAADRRKAVKGVAATGMIAVVGEANATPVALRRSAAGIEIGTTAYGDGRVTWESAAVGSDGPWHVPAPFGNLIADRSGFGGYVELLEAGQTRLLPRPRLTAAGRDTAWNAPDDAPLLLPDNDDLAEAGVGPRSAGAPAQPPLSLRVSITNGDVNTARHPVLVGHYFGDPIVSVEKVLDRLLNNALSRRFNLRIYPGADGTNAVIFGAKGTRPEGAVVIGLGKVGEFNAEKLRRAVTDAVIRYSMAVVERLGDGAPPAVSISTLLLGSNGGTALSIESSIQAVVRGVVDANRAFVLRDHAMRISEVEFVELFEGRAVVAAHALSALGDRMKPELAPHESLEIDSDLKTTDYIRYDAPLSDYAGGWPRRVRIVREPGCKDEEPALRFTVLTDRARAETTLQCTSERLVKGLVDASATNAAFDTKTATALYELLIPNDIKDAAGDETNVVLVVDDTAAQYPWELCVDRLGPTGLQPFDAAGGARTKPISIDMGLVRQFETDKFRLHPRTPQANLAFVVGDTDSGLTELDGAKREAEEVAGLLGGRRYAVTHLDRPDSGTFLRELFSADYRVLHIAAHGHFDEDHPKRSGIVVGKDTYITAFEIGQMRVVPELVFLNCCHIGQLGKFHRIAASVARELIEMGVAAVVAAGWAVDDKAAVTFATTFYDALITQRLPFSKAVTAARQQTWRMHPDTNTWGAYQCYGNPDFRLVIDGDDGATAVKLCSRYEYLSRFRSALSESNQAGFDERRQMELAKELKALRAEMKSDWADGELETAYGLAIGEFGDYKTAIDTLEKTRTIEKSTISLKALEQLANFRARYAVELYVQAGNQQTDEVKAQIAESERLLQWLLDGGKTAERLSLMGGTWKRKAFIAETTYDQNRTLITSADYYRQADAIKPKQPYTVLNPAVLEGLADPDPAKRQALLDEVNGIEAETRRVGDAATDVWDALAPGDLMLTRCIVSEAGPDEIRQAAREFRSAALRFGTALKLRSVREHLALIAKVLRDRGKAAHAAAVDEIRTALG